MTEAKARLSELVAAVATTQDRIDITRNGEPATSLVSWAAYTFITKRLPSNPHRLGGELSAPYDGRRSARLGTYRVVYRIDEPTRTVYVLSIRLRGDVYGMVWSSASLLHFPS